MTKKKALIAMSGGVDSSVAAYLTQKAGYEIMGVNMHLFDGNRRNQDNEKSCCSVKDTLCANSVAERLGFPFHVWDYTAQFKEMVINNFIKAYETGRTPNPCIDCNRYLKFSALYDRAEQLGMDCIVTGHYSLIDRDEESGLYRLHKAVDPSKDQSYVLYNLTQKQLAHTFFPLGGMTKEETRRIADEMGFINARKPDSQDICFVPDGDYSRFISEETGKEYPHGDFVDEEGNVLGEHKGIIRYTIGQRKGLGLALPQPMYVKEKDVANNRVVLCVHEHLFTREFDAVDFNWISGKVPEEPICVNARVRYNQQEKPATVTPVGTDSVHVCFDEPMRAITRGQAVVLYDGDIVVGGGTIA